MNHRQKMSEKQRLDFDSWKYKRSLEEKRGHNYQYHNDKLEEDLLKKGYKWHDFGSGLEHTNIEDDAKWVVEDLREQGNYARIICGRMKVVQKVKYYSVIFKKR